jgi:hypothetical protein
MNIIDEDVITESTQMMSMADKPFYNLTAEMLNCVRDHNFDRLAKICDDDYGIIDINTEGGSEIIRDREGWENWFRGLFDKMKNMKARTWSEITGYEAIQKDEMGYSVVDFNQYIDVDGKTMCFFVIATIIWKKEKNQWKEARWHSSLVGIKQV